MNDRATKARPATQRQLRYLRALAQQTGTTFARPRTSTQASREIKRLLALRAARGRHRELPDQSVRGVQPGYATAPRRGSLDGWGTDRPSERTQAPPAPTSEELARYTVNGCERVIAVERLAKRLRLTDRPAGGEDDEYVIEPALEDEGKPALDALVTDYVRQAARARPGADGARRPRGGGAVTYDHLGMTLDVSGLPGSELLSAGLADLRAGRESESALAVAVAAPRLRALGIDVPEQEHAESPEHRLYALLAATHGDGAHSRYNALLGRMASFARAAEHASAR